jgi:hypothetical protein
MGSVVGRGVFKDLLIPIRNVVFWRELRETRLQEVFSLLRNSFFSRLIKNAQMQGARNPEE